MIIDFHTHIFPPSLREQRQRYVELEATFAELFTNPRSRMATAEELVEAMEEDGVDRSVVMGIGWTDRGLARESNDYLIESVRRFPAQLVGFAGVNPGWGSEAAREAERCARAGLRGIGELHPHSQAFDLGDRRTLAPLAEVAAEYKLVLTTHSSEPVGHAYQGKGTTGPEALWRLIQNFPDLTVVCAHWGGGLPFYALMPEVARGMSNVYFDTAASPFLYSPRVFSTVAALVGAEKILLGSDFPLLRPRRLIRELTESSLPSADKEGVKGQNAAALLGP